MSATPKSAWGGVRALLHSVYGQPDADAVRAQFDRILDSLGEKLPQVAAQLHEARDLLGIFPARDAVTRLVGAVLAEQHDESTEMCRYTGLDILTRCRQALSPAGRPRRYHWPGAGCLKVTRIRLPRCCPLVLFRGRDRCRKSAYCQVQEVASQPPGPDPCLAAVAGGTAMFSVDLSTSERGGLTAASVAAGGGDLRLAATQQQVLRVLAITRLVGSLSLHAGVGEAASRRGQSPAAASFVAVFR
jgi:Transposase, Mutator family